VPSDAPEGTYTVSGTYSANDISPSRTLGDEDIIVSSNPLREIRSMQFGVMCAAAFAASGKLPERLQLEDSVSDLIRSEEGIKQATKLQDLMGGEQLEGGVRGEYRDYLVCILPTIICEKPVSTVGLGDTVSSATFLRWLELIGTNEGQSRLEV
jgi:ADP-dependent phosphofructokinase/glucokinase